MENENIIKILETQVNETKSQLKYFECALKEIKKFINETSKDIDANIINIEDLENICVNLIRANIDIIPNIYSKIRIKRTREPANADKRHNIRFILRQVPMGYSQIARLMRCDHTTVIASEKKHRNYIYTKDKLYLENYKNTLIEIITIININIKEHQ